ncbi:MAG: hypothetical protein LBN12_02865 [Clostridiales Family XIII bacterium]|jgi:hypothetical protein|nr:hypothetical protein [Clostridiales Family XIII bacterium]
MAKTIPKRIFASCMVILFTLAFFPAYAEEVPAQAEDAQSAIDYPAWALLPDGSPNPAFVDQNGEMMEIDPDNLHDSGYVYSYVDENGQTVICNAESAPQVLPPQSGPDAESDEQVTVQDSKTFDRFFSLNHGIALFGSGSAWRHYFVPANTEVPLVSLCLEKGLNNPGDDSPTAGVESGAAGWMTNLATWAPAILRSYGLALGADESVNATLVAYMQSAVWVHQGSISATDGGLLDALVAAIDIPAVASDPQISGIPEDGFCKPTVVTVSGKEYGRYGPYTYSGGSNPAAVGIYKGDPANNVPATGAYVGKENGTAITNPVANDTTFYLFLPKQQTDPGSINVRISTQYASVITARYFSVSAGQDQLVIPQWDSTVGERAFAFRLGGYGDVEVTKADGDVKRSALAGAVFKIHEWNGTAYVNTSYDVTWDAAERKYKSEWLYETLTNGGRFRLVETAAPYSYKIGSPNYWNFTLNHVKTTFTVTRDNDPVYAKIPLQKLDNDTGGAIAQGDATLAGAKYQLFYNETKTHPDGTKFTKNDPVLIDKDGIQRSAGTPYIVTTDAAGKAEFRTLFPMKYYIIEIPSDSSGSDTATGSDGYLVDPVKHEVDAACLAADPVAVTRNITSKEQVKKQGFDILKLSEIGVGQEFRPLVGAGFKVYLISSLTDVANGKLPKPAGGWTGKELAGIDFSKETAAKIDGTVQPERFSDSLGKVTFPEYPYGSYIVVETTVPTGYRAIDPFIIRVTKDSRVHQPWRYFNDDDKFQVRIVKKDAETGNIVLGKNAAYRIFDLTENKYVEMRVTYPAPAVYGTSAHPFETGDDGKLLLPQLLAYGTYRLEEVTAPEGYVVAGSEPNPSAAVIIDFTGMIYDPEAEENVVEVIQENEQQKGHIDLLKEKEDPDDTGEPPYDKFPMEDVEFHLYAAEDIYAQDGSGDIVHAAGALIGSMITDADGKAAMDGIYLGKYILREYAAGDSDKVMIGGVLRNQYYFAEDVEIEFTAQDQETSIIYADHALVDAYRLGRIVIEKTGEETKEPLAGAVFEVTAKNDIYDAFESEKVWSKDDIIATITTDENGTATLADLLPGEYTLRETEAPDGYLPIPDEDFTIGFRGRTEKFEFYTLNLIDKIDKKEDLLVAVEVDKDTIKRTSAAFVSLPDQRGYNNVGEKDERYRYDVDFRSTSNVDADEFVVDDNLENAREQLVYVEELWTPVVWGDTDGKWNLWYKTNKTRNNIVYAPDQGALVYPNTGFKPWKTGLDTDKRYRLLVKDLPLASGEYLTALRFEYGHVEVGFTSKNYADKSQDGEHRGKSKGQVDLGKDTKRLALLRAGAAQDRYRGSIKGDTVDWTPAQNAPFYPPDPAAGAELKAAKLYPASYLVSAVRPMADVNIVSSVSARIAKATDGDPLKDHDQDAVITKELVTFAIEDEKIEPGSVESDSLISKLGKSFKTADPFMFAEWFLALIGAGLAIIILLLVRRNRKERSSGYVQ